MPGFPTENKPARRLGGESETRVTEKLPSFFSYFGALHLLPRIMVFFTTNISRRCRCSIFRLLSSVLIHLHLHQSPLISINLHSPPAIANFPASSITFGFVSYEYAGHLQVLHEFNTKRKITIEIEIKPKTNFLIRNKRFSILQIIFFKFNGLIL